MTKNIQRIGLTNIRGRKKEREGDIERERDNKERGRDIKREKRERQ